MGQNPGQSLALPSVLYGWRSKIIALRYSLSYVKLFEVKFKALEDPEAFDPNRRPADKIRPPVEEIPESYDVLVVRHQALPGEIPIIQRLPKTLRYVPRQLFHYYTDLSGGAGSAFQSMSSKTRSTLVRKVRSYERFCGGEVRWRAYATPQEMVEFHREARRIASNTYQERLFNGGLPDTQAFRTRMLELAERDQVRGFLLFHGDKPIAYLYTPAPDGFLIYDYLGYDPAYAQHSPGTVLQYLVLRRLYAEGDFPFYYWGYGYSQTKQVFCTGQVLAADIYYFRPTLRNVIAVWLHYGTDRFSEKMGLLMRRLRLKEFIKRWLKRNMSAVALRRKQERIEPPSATPRES